MFVPDANGLVTAVTERTRALAKAGNEVLLVAPHSGDPLVDQYLGSLRAIGVHVVTYASYWDAKNGMHRPVRASVSRVANAQIIEFAPQVLFVDSPLMFFLFARFLPCFRRLRTMATQVVGVCHANVSEGLRRGGFPVLSRIVRALGPLIYNRYDVTVMPSEYLKGCVSGVKNALVVPFLGCLDDSERRASRLDASGRIILYVGRIDREKNIDFLYSVASELVEELPADVLWCFVGGGGMLQYWRERQTERIRFVGPVPRSDVWGWYERAYAFVTACGHESFGLTVAEAMAAGLPTVVPASGMAQLHVPDECAELVFQPGDREGLKGIVSRLVCDAGFHRRMSNHRSMLHMSWDEGTSRLMQAVTTREG